MSKRNSKKRAAPASTGTASNSNTPHPTPCACARQLHFAGFTPPLEPGEGPVEAYLRTRPGWHDRRDVAAALSLTDREVRAQAEHSGGLIIFSSQRGRGLRHSFNADVWEMNACQAELRTRSASHLRRNDEIEVVKQQRRAGR